MNAEYVETLQTSILKVGYATRVESVKGFYLWNVINVQTVFPSPPSTKKGAKKNLISKRIRRRRRKKTIIFTLSMGRVFFPCPNSANVLRFCLKQCALMLRKKEENRLIASTPYYAIKIFGLFGLKEVIKRFFSRWKMRIANENSKKKVSNQSFEQRIGKLQSRS